MRNAEQEKKRIQDSWIGHYYDALEFYYWEPQHLGQKKAANSTLKNSAEVMKRLHRIEVPLNQLMKLFFSSAPISLRNRLFESIEFVPPASQSFSGKFAMAGRDIMGDHGYVYKSNAQPDLLFTADGETVALEMKIESKSWVGQALRYALLDLAIELDNDNKRELKHSLIYLGKTDFQNLWKKRFSTVGNLRQALEEEMHSFLFKRKACFHEHEERFSAIVKSLSIGFINYKDFTVLLEDEEAHLDGSMGSEVYRNLLSGMLGELKARGLS